MFSPLMKAAFYGHRSAVEALLDAGADITTPRTSNGCTPLHFAASRGHVETVVALLSGHDDKDVLAKNGDTPMIVAAIRGNRSVVEAMLDAGADATIRRANGMTALHVAANEGHDGTVVALLSVRTDTDALDGLGNTPLMIAVSRVHQSIVRALLGAGADVNVRCARDDGVHAGMTALHLAVRKKTIGVIEALINHGADVHSRDDKKNQPLHIACRGFDAHKEVVSLLLRAGADGTALNGDGKTPADLLQKWKREANKGVRLLLRRASAWRRRGWIFMLFSRDSKAGRAGCKGDDVETQPAQHESGVIGGGSGSHAVGRRTDLSGAIELLGMAPDGVFRTVIKFL